MKKVISLLLSVILLVTSIIIGAVPTFAEDTISCTYSESDGVLTLTGTGDVNAPTDKVTPAWTTYKNVAKTLNVVGDINIGASAFEAWPVIETINLDYKVITIQNSAFYNMPNLKSVNYVDYNTNDDISEPMINTIGDLAFSKCTKLTSVEIAPNMKTLGKQAYAKDKALTKVTMATSNEGVELSMGNRVFEDCVNLVSVNIQANLNEITLCCFSDCTSLSYVVLPESLNSINRSAFSKTAIAEITIPDKTKIIGSSAFHSCEKLTTVYGGSNITDIGTLAFAYTSLANFEMPNNLNSIGNNAFESADIKTAIMPDTLTQLGQEAFSFCDKLEKVVISQNITDIPKKCFYRCINLKDIEYSDHLTEIKQQAFDNCTNLISVKLPNTLTTIEKDAFYRCGLTDVTIPGSVETIGDAAFWGNDLIHASIDAKNIQTSAFANNTELKNVEFGTNVKNIGDFAFDSNSKLDNVDVPENVTSIAANAFLDNSSMKKITIRNNECNLGSNCIDSSVTIFCDENSSADNYAKSNGNKTNCIDEHILSTKIVEATCTKAGYVITACEKCDYQTKKTIPATGHKWSTGTVIKKATCNANGKIQTKCTVCGALKTKSIIYYPKTITLSATSYTYNGKVKKPSVTVKDSKGKKISSKYYTISYSKGRKNVGKYTVTIKFKGNYSGTVKKTFTIKPKSTSINGLTAGKKKFTVKWKKQTTQTTGYQIQYSTSSKFSSSKTVTVSKNKTTSKTISKLKAKKKYYVRVRTYKTVGKTKYYSSWSKAKSVTTKK